MTKKIRITDLLAKKGIEPITCLTAYDYTSARLLDEAGIDSILVGDSLGMVMQGLDSTVPVTLDEMIYHSKLVRRGTKNAFMLVDMPFGTYTTLEDGIRNCVRMVQETGADGLKLEGAFPVLLEMISRLRTSGINVMGHIGLQPQMVNVTGGFKVQGRTNAGAILEEARLLEEAGACMLLLEGMTEDSAKAVTESVSIPTIGIGAGVHCDGQVLVYHDVFGIYREFVPKFVKQYANMGDEIISAARAYIKEVKERAFPSEEYIYKSK